METQNIPIGKYQHFKGDYYEVLGIAHHSETLEELVVYRGLYYSHEYGTSPLWVRPKSLFFEKVMKDGKQIARFRFVE